MNAHQRSQLVSALAASYYERHAMPAKFFPSGDSPRIEDFERMVDTFIAMLPRLGLELMEKSHETFDSVVLTPITKQEAPDER